MKTAKKRVVRMKIPNRGAGAGRKLALKIQERNLPCFVRDPQAHQSGWVLEKHDGPLTIRWEDYEPYAAAMGLAWSALPLWVVSGEVSKFDAEKLILKPVEEVS